MPGQTAPVLKQFGISLSLLVFVLVGCGSGVAGTYKVLNATGEGTAKTSLELRGDQSFEILLDGKTMSKGTWKSEGTQVKLFAGSDTTPTETYNIEGGKLVHPQAATNKDVITWTK